MENKQVTLRFFQPSWVLIQHAGRVIYIDPAYMQKYYMDYPGKVEFSSPPEPIDGLPEADLPKAELILITHHHQDHCMAATIRRLIQEDTLIAAPAVCGEELEEFGDMVRYVQPGGTLEMGDVTAEAVFAYNTEAGSSTKKIHKKGECLGWLLRLGGRTIYHAGDTDFIPEMSGLGPVDLALLPVGGTYTMNIDEAVDAAAAINPGVVIPMHDRGEDTSGFKGKVEKRCDCKVVVLKTGGTYTL